ncbi:uncharacterized protein LOC121415829 isoform X1 [Lytechinus variegatus]|uniref:uncharacterized protein LOC121415829 isoform X1 n=1 Tax=Lytechinus variegatus TaxID=7654 RepID=UPI001BB29C7F|nr:uncharacterized protein LOC121415829 isoform X1 [Lytechinus variegatus]
MDSFSELHENLLQGHCLCHIKMGNILELLDLGSQVRGQGLEGEISFTTRDQVLVKLGLIISIHEINHCSNIEQVQQALCSSENLELLLSMLGSRDQLIAHSASRCLEAHLLLLAKFEKDKVECLLKQAISSMLHHGGELEKVSSAINRTVFTLDLMSNMLRGESAKSGQTNRATPTLPCMGISSSATDEGSRPIQQTSDGHTVWYYNVIKESILELCAVFSNQFDEASNAQHASEHEQSSISWLHSLNIAYKHKIYHAFLRLLLSFTKEQMGTERGPFSTLPFIQSVLPHLQAVLVTYSHGSIANLKMVLGVLIMFLQACVKASESAKCGAVETSDIGLLQSLHSSWSGLLADICEDLWLEQMPYHKGPVGFGGFTFASEEVHDRSSEEYIRGDIVILRKLAQLVLLGVELGISSGIEFRPLARNFYQMCHFIESKLQEALLQQEESMDQGRWIFEIFGDQDDTLIEIMLILLKISLSAQTHLEEESDESSYSESRGEIGDPENKIPAEKSGCILDAHHIFVSFLDHMSWDNSILLDLLISTETEFLEYFIRYLRFVTNNWQGFVRVQKSFRKKEEDNDNVSCEMPTRYNASGDDGSHDDDDDVSDGCSNIDEDINETRISKDDVSDNTLDDHMENDVSRNKTSADKNDLCGQTEPESLPQASEKFPVKRKWDIEEAHENATRRIKKTQGEELFKVPLPLDTKQCSHEDCSVNDPLASELGCLDDTMTVLIRLRLAIERLDRKRLFPFSAAPLIRILVKVEDMYEAMDG